MKPPACVRCKWGTGTTSEKQHDSAAAKEVKSNFEKMMAERAKQDAAWFTQDAQTKPVSSVLNDPGMTKK